MRWAIVINGIVDNIVLWDGVTEWMLPANSQAIQLLDVEWCGIGCLYNESAALRFYPAPAEE